jgi:hypothetical protein
MKIHHIAVSLSNGGVNMGFDTYLSEERNIPLTFMDCPKFKNGIHPIYGIVGGVWGQGDYCCDFGSKSTVCKWNRDFKRCPRGFQ